MSRRIVTAPRASTLIWQLCRSQIEQHGTSHWILPANICPAVPLALLGAGGSFVFVDIAPDTWCMDIREVRTLLPSKPRPTAILYARTYGVSMRCYSDLAMLRQFVSDDVLLVDDQCSSLPPQTLDNNSSSVADATIFSTGYGKYADLGGGGFAFVASADELPPPPPVGSPEVFPRLERAWKKSIVNGLPLYVDGTASAPSRKAALADPSWLGGPLVPWSSYESRISAALPEISMHKAEINAIYDDGLDFLNRPDSDRTSWRYNIVLSDAEVVSGKIFEAGIFCSRHYYPAPFIFGFGRSYPSAELLASQILNLVNDRNITAGQAGAVVHTIRKHYGK